jgi:hypothetical protein
MLSEVLFSIQSLLACLLAGGLLYLMVINWSKREKEEKQASGGKLRRNWRTTGGRIYSSIGRHDREHA